MATTYKRTSAGLTRPSICTHAIARGALGDPPPQVQAVAIWKGDDGYGRPADIALGLDLQLTADMPTPRYAGIAADPPYSVELQLTAVPAEKIWQASYTLRRDGEFLLALAATAPYDAERPTPDLRLSFPVELTRPPFVWAKVVL
jgi:hypothetical protein